MNSPVLARALIQEGIKALFVEFIVLQGAGLS